VFFSRWGFTKPEKGAVRRSHDATLTAHAARLRAADITPAMLDRTDDIGADRCFVNRWSSDGAGQATDTNPALR